MSLFELDCVSRAFTQGAHRRTVLSDVSLQIEAGEVVAVWGLRRSGRSTLLRVAAGIEPVDRGVVRFQGVDISSRGIHTLGQGIGYCQRSIQATEGRVVLEELMVGQLARGIPPALARRCAADALQRVAASHCTTRLLPELDAGEAVRVELARALSLSPSLIVIDEPVKGVDLLERDEILMLLRSIADEGIAVLMSAGEATALLGADRALSLADGQLRGSVAPQLAEVLPLPRRRAV
ncbi:MAG: ATP-binding cassette domain-containing protein [Solirubrobacteraceae bacterium]